MKMNEKLINEYINNLATQVNNLTQENILLKTMFELPDMENVIKVTVDSTSVKGITEPIVTYGKKSSTSVA